MKQNIHKHQTQKIRRISPFGISPVKKVHKARTRWYHDGGRLRQHDVEWADKAERQTRWQQEKHAEL